MVLTKLHQWPKSQIFQHKEFKRLEKVQDRFAQKTGFERIEKIEQLIYLNKNLDLNEFKKLNKKRIWTDSKNQTTLYFERKTRSERFKRIEQKTRYERIKKIEWKLDLNNLSIERNLFLNRFKKLQSFISERKSGSEWFKTIEQKNWIWMNL